LGSNATRGDFAARNCNKLTRSQSRRCDRRWRFKGCFPGNNRSGAETKLGVNRDAAGIDIFYCSYQRPSRPAYLEVARILE
jgi:hypothetical protein